MISAPPIKKCRPGMGGLSGREGLSVSRTPTVVHNLFDDAIPLAQEHNAAQIDLCACLLCDPSRVVPIVRNEGITPSAFTENDLSLIAAGVFVAAEYHAPREQCLRIIERALRLDGFWDDHAAPPMPFGCRWSRRNLSILASSEFFCRPRIELVARRLLSIDQRIREARSHLIRAAKLIRGAA